MNTQPFDRAAAERRLGPAAVVAIRRNAAAAPPLRPEQREQVRAVFASARTTVGTNTAPAAAA